MKLSRVINELSETKLHKEYYCTYVYADQLNENWGYGYHEIFYGFYERSYWSKAVHHEFLYEPL